MNTLIRDASGVLMTAIFLGAASGAYAQSSTDHSPMKGMNMSKPGAMKMDSKPVDVKDQATTPVTMTEGEVRKVDKDLGNVTLKHGEIKNLGMPGMTMVFRAQDKAMLDSIKEGDKVKFAADIVNNQLMVTRIEQVQ